MARTAQTDLHVDRRDHTKLLSLKRFRDQFDRSIEIRVHYSAKSQFVAHLSCFFVLPLCFLVLSKAAEFFASFPRTAVFRRLWLG